MFKRLLITTLIALSVIIPVRPHSIVATGWTEVYQCAGLQANGSMLAKLLIKGTVIRQGYLPVNPTGLHLTVIDNVTGVYLFSLDVPLNYYVNGAGYAVNSINGNVQIYLYAWQTSDNTPLYYLIYDPNRTC